MTSLSYFQRLQHFFAQPSFSTYNSIEENIGEPKEIFTFISQQSYYQPSDILGNWNSDLRRMILLSYKSILHADKSPVLRHRYHDNLVWTQEELNFFPSIWNNPEEIGHLIFNINLKKPYAHSLKNHFLTTGVYHPIVWELPSEDVLELRAKFPHFFTEERFNDIVMPRIREFVRQEHDMLITAIHLGHSYPDFWKSFFGSGYTQSVLPLDVIQMYLDDIPFDILADIYSNLPFEDISLEQIRSLLLRLYHHHPEPDAFSLFLQKTRLPFCQLAFYELEEFLPLNYVQLLAVTMLADTQLLHPQMHPNNLQWILEHYDNNSFVIKEYQTFQQCTHIQELFTADHYFLYSTPSLMAFHLMHVQSIPNKDTILSLLYNMNYEHYFYALTGHENAVGDENWHDYLEQHNLFTGPTQLLEHHKISEEMPLML